MAIGEGIGRYNALFISLALIFLLTPFLETGTPQEIFLDALFLGVLLAAVFAVRRRVYLLLPFTLGMLFTPSWHLVPPSTTTVVITIVSQLGFILLAGTAIIRDVLTAKRVTTVARGSVQAASRS